MGRGTVSRRKFLLGGLAVAGGTVLSGALAPGDAWAFEPPPIIDCAGWGARPNSKIVPVAGQRPVKILVHHTATPNVPPSWAWSASALPRKKPWTTSASK